MAVIYTPKEKKKIIVRVILFIAVLLGAVGLIIFLFFHFRTKEGFQTISNDYGEILYAGNSYQFNYYVDDRDGSISKTQSAVTQLYSAALDEAYELIDDDTSYDDANNIKTINSNPNTDVVLNEELYNYLKVIYDFNPDYLYLGGIYSYWDSELYNTDLLTQSANDPLNNSGYADAIANYMSSYKGNISLEFKGNNTVCLNVSSDFKKAFDDGDNYKYIGLNMFEEAFIIDYVRAYFVASGYTDGFMISDTGYAEDFGMRDGLSASINMLSGAYVVKTFEMTSRSYIDFMGFQLSSVYPYYEVKKGEITYHRSRLINPETGYSDYDSKSLLVMDDTSLTKLLISLYGYLGGAHEIAYADLKYDEKIYTDITGFTSDRYEVVYE